MINTMPEIFKRQSIKHARLVDCYQQLQQIHMKPDGERVILLVGPTGVGKSKLLERIHNDCQMHYAVEMDQDTGFIPSLFMKLPSPTPRLTGRSDFDWKDTFIRLLESGNEVLIRRKVIPKAKIELDGEIITDVHSLVGSELRRSIEKFVQFRHIRQVMLDEAGHIFVADSGKNYHLHFELLKSMAIAFQRPLILSGSYDLLKATELNGQLARRIEIIHFQRYTHDDFDTDKNHYGQSFGNAVFTLLERIPIPKEDGLLDRLDYFLMKSLGCIGILKEWLERALALALQEVNPILSKKVLEKSALSNKRLIKILREIKLGEETLEDVKDQELARELGLEATPSLSQDFGTARNSDQTKEDKKATTKPTVKKRRVGIRNPGRDPVGGIANAA